MDSNSTRPVTETEHSEVDVIGLNGATLVACGTGQPIVRRPDDGMICRLTVALDSREWLPEAYFERYLAEGRVCRLESPIRMALDTNTAGSPLILFVNDDFIGAADLTLPAVIQTYPVGWTLIVGEAIRTHATCLPGEVAKQWLNDRARQLCDKIDRHLAEPAVNPESLLPTLQKWADLGLCAATDKQIRWKLYLRYGSAMEPDRVRRTFDSFIQREFSGCTWDFYLKEMKDIKSVIRSQARASTSVCAVPVVVPSQTNRLHKLHCIAQKKPVELSLVHI